MVANDFFALSHIQQGCLTLDVFLLVYLWAKTLHREDHAGKWWFSCVINEWQVTKRRFILLWRTGRRFLRVTHLNTIQKLAVWWQIGKRFLYRYFFPSFYHSIQRLLLLSFLLLALFFSWIVSVLPMFEEEHLLKYYPESWLEELNPDSRNSRKTFVWTAWLHEQRRADLSKDEVLDYDEGRVRDCQDKRPSGTEKRCYIVDSWIPRNLILRDKVLTKNKLEPEIIKAFQTTDKKITPEILAKISGLDLQDRHFEYADFSFSSLPNTNLSRARLKKVNLFNARLYGANLNTVELNGAIVEVEFVGLTGLKLSEQTSQFKKALKNLTIYQNEDGKKQLNSKIDAFAKKIAQPANFKEIKTPKPACLSGDKSITACKNYLDANNQKNLVNYWLNLACQDKWLAQEMISRTHLVFDLPKSLRTQLANILQKEAAKGKQACTDIADLSDDWKQKLAKVAEKTKP